MTEVHRINFHGDNLVGVQHDRAIWIPLKPISEAIGLDWHNERRRIGDHPTLAKGTTIIVVPFGGGGPQRMVCAELRRVNFWLATIHPNQVQESIRDRLILYQEECADVLAAYFHGGKLPDSTGITSSLWHGSLFPDAPVQVSPKAKPRRSNRVLEVVEYIKDTVDWLRLPILQAAYGRGAKMVEDERERPPASGLPPLAQPRQEFKGPPNRNYRKGE